MSKRLTTQEFILKSTSKHGNRYDYSNTEYVSEKSLISINCLEHGIFYQLPSVHYRSGCPTCGIIKRINLRKNNIDELLNKFNIKHNFKYDYSKVDYVKMKEKVIITCKEHNIEFLQTPEKHLSSKTGGCVKCNSIGKGKLTTLQFIEKSDILHNSKYDYSKLKYLESNTKVTIVCKEHGDFTMTPNSHLNGRGCSKCNRNGGILENIWLDSFGIHKDYRQYKIDKFYVDGINLDENIIYEFNGDFWHGNPNIYKGDDINKVNGIKYGELYKKTIEREECLKSLGYKIVSIWESDFKKINNRLCQ